VTSSATWHKLSFVLLAVSFRSLSVCHAWLMNNGLPNVLSFVTTVYHHDPAHRVPGVLMAIAHGKVGLERAWSASLFRLVPIIE
jgi:hypothetical protein